MKRFISCLLILVLLSSTTCVVATAEESSVKYTSYNLELSATGIGVYDCNYGDTTGTDDKHYEVTVENGCVTKIGGYNSTIPKNGYVISARGERYHKKLETVKISDYCINDKQKSTVTFLDENYDPFYSNTINFDKFNGVRTADTIVIYNTGNTTGTNIWGTEVTVNADGFVSAIGGNDNAIPEGGYVISAVGAARIKELNEAAGIGLRVTVDEKKKTITFAYDEESLCAAAKIKLDSAKNMLNQAKDSFLLIDYDIAQEAVEVLDSLYSAICESITENNIPKAVATESAFNENHSAFKYLVTESPAVEGRAMWLRPSGLTNAEAVAKRVKEIKDMGFNIICLEVLYDSVFICPMPEDGYFIQNPSLNGFDLLDAFVSECAKQGVELNAWLSVYRVSYSTSTYYSQSLAAKKPDWLCLSKSGADYVANEYGNGYFIDPSNTEAREYLLSVYKYILENYKLDGLQLDYIRYPHQTGEYFGYNEGTRAAFKELYGVDPINIAPGGDKWDEWINFRCDFVTDFVKEIVSTAKQISPMTIVSCDIAPNLEESRKTHLQDAKKWLEEGIIEIGYPMAYGTNVVPMYAGYTVDACGEDSLAYIGVGDYGVDVFAKQILESREEGADGVAFFSYSQYMAGDYAKQIASTLFSTPALSPSYNCKAAAKALMETINSRLEMMKDILPENEINQFLSKIALISDALETDALSQHAKDITELCEMLEKISDKGALSALQSDIKLLKKTVKISRDDYREFIATEDESDISDISSDTSVSDSADSFLPPWSIAVIAVILLISAGAVITVIKKKKA